MFPADARGQATQPAAPATGSEPRDLEKLDPAALRKAAADSMRLNAELRENLANALARIEKLESEVRRLRAYAPPTEAEAMRAEKLGPIKPAPEKAADAPASPPAAADAPRMPYTNLVTLLQTLPADVRPSPKMGWTDEVLEKSFEWMNANMLGAKVDLSIVVTKTEVKNIKPVGNSSPSELWEVQVWHQPIEFEFATTHVAAHFFNTRHYLTTAKDRYHSLIPTERLSWKVDEATAKRCKALKPGQTIKLRGNIQRVLSTSKAQGRECWFYFRMTDLAPLQ